eukprot:2673713-Rhodomonas_salina.5
MANSPAASTICCLTPSKATDNALIHFPPSSNPPSADLPFKGNALSSSSFAVGGGDSKDLDWRSRFSIESLEAPHATSAPASPSAHASRLAEQDLRAGLVELFGEGTGSAGEEGENGGGRGCGLKGEEGGELASAPPAQAPLKSSLSHTMSSPRARVSAHAESPLPIPAFRNLPLLNNDRASCRTPREASDPRNESNTIKPFSRTVSRPTLASNL